MSVPDPRAWVGDAPYPWPAVAELGAGAAIVACYALVQIQLARTRQDRPYARLQLADARGAVEARIWDDAERRAEGLRPGMYVGVRGRVEVFNNERQLRIDEIGPIRVGLDDLELFLARSPRDADAMERELATLVVSVGDAGLRGLLERLLGPGSACGPGFRLAPAAKQNHHAYLGGLLEHTLSVARLCDAIARHYGDALDRDLLVTAALVHDVGKVREIGAQAGFPYTDEGKLLGHILLGLQMVREAATGVEDLAPRRLLLLEHLVASHQGRYEYQSPREPRILEALALHYADDLDAKLHHAAGLLAPLDGGWTTWDRSLGRDLLQHRERLAAAAKAAPAAPAGAPAAAAAHLGARPPVAPPEGRAEPEGPATLDLFTT